MAKNPIYDFPGGVIMTPPLDASMAFYPLALQGLIAPMIDILLWVLKTTKLNFMWSIQQIIFTLGRKTLI